MASKFNPSIALLLLIVSALLSAAVAAHFTPTDNYLLNCGGATASVTLYDRRIFTPDSLSSSLHRLSARRSATLYTAAAAAAAAASPLYSTARVFHSPATYTFPIKSNGSHVLRLHFYPFETALSTAVFHITAGDFVLLSNFTAGPDQLEIPKEFLIEIETGDFSITFTPATANSIAFVNAIEVFSAPPGIMPEEARLVKSDHVEDFNGVSANLLETVYRVNVGGAKVTPYNDTLWRTWMPDTEFFMPVGSPSVSDLTFGARIMYRKFGASREIAPDSVYRTARVLRIKNVSDINTNISWDFAVDAGYKYLIRMHFCDIASLALNELFFNVYLNDYLAFKDFDLSQYTDQLLASPYYVDFVAEMEGSGVLRVGVGPTKWSRPLRADALLNGLEIFKISNTRLVRGSHCRGVGFDTLLRSITCGLAFATLCMVVVALMLRLKAQVRKSVAWTRLPSDVSDDKSRNACTELPSKLVYV